MGVCGHVSSGNGVSGFGDPGWTAPVRTVFEDAELIVHPLFPWHALLTVNHACQARKTKKNGAFSEFCHFFSSTEAQALAPFAA